MTVTSERGSPSAALPDLTGPKGRQLADVVSHGGIDVVGFFGHGGQRRLAMAAGAPSNFRRLRGLRRGAPTGGYDGSQWLPGVEYALYDGRTETSPLLFATTRSLPFTGQPVRQLVDINNLNGSTPPKSGDGVLLFVVARRASPSDDWPTCCRRSWR